jgi:hypothetical protein
VKARKQHHDEDHCDCVGARYSYWRFSWAELRWPSP